MSSLPLTSEERLKTLQEELKWVTLQAKDNELEPFEKLKKKCLDNPLVPLGSFATVGALVYGIYNLHLGNQKTQQLMMRCRVLAQGLTIGATLVGIFIVQFQKKKG